MNNVDWNAFRYVVAISRSGSAAAAGRLLGVSHATVLRRIQTLEEAVGSPLFERHSTGYSPTEMGRALANVGETIESALTDLGRSIDARAETLAGKIRFTTTDSMACFLLPPILASFKEEYPAIEVELLVTNQILDLDRRDADVTLRPSNEPPQSWIGMRLARCDFGLYAGPKYLAARSGVAQQDMAWLLPDGALGRSPAFRWLRSHLGQRTAAVTVDSFVGLRELALSDIGATILPIFVGEACPGLELIAPAAPEASVDLWLLTHADLKRSNRIQVFMQHLAREIRLARAQLQWSDESAID